jgi:hypothetical protein
MTDKHERECLICEGTGIREYGITENMPRVETCDICGGSGKLIVPEENVTEPLPPLPAGDYCIAEIFGHQTIVGRYREVEKFGVKMLAIEPLFNDVLLDCVFHGGASIYRLTPCSSEVAREQQPKHGYQLPPAIKAIVPAGLLPAPGTNAAYGRYESDDDDEIPL